MYGNKDLFRTLFEISPDAICVLNKGGEIVYSNHRAAVLYGAGSIEDIIGKNIKDFIAPADYPRAMNNLARILQGEETAKNEYCFIKKDGSKIFGETTSFLINTIDDISPAILVVARDITERKQFEESLQKIHDELEISVNQQTQELRELNERLLVEIAEHEQVNEALRESEVRYRTAIDFTYDWEYWIDPEGKYIYVSPSCERISGYSSEEFLRDQELLKRIIYPEDQKLFLNFLEDDSPAKAIEFRVITRSGKECWIQHICQPVFSENGKFLGRRASIREITERRKAEEAVRAADAYNRSLIETSIDPLVTISPNGKITDVNSATEVVTGYSREELIGTDFSDYFTEPDKARTGYQQVFETGLVRDYALEIRHRDGHITSVLYNASVYRDNTGNVIGIFADARDITELKRAEEAVRAAGAYNRSLIETSLDPLVTIGPDGKITDVNTATEVVTGYSREKLIGTDFSEYFTESNKARFGYQQVFEKGLVRDYALDIRHRDGHITPVLYNASVYRDSIGNVIGVFAAARDITELRRTEIELVKYHEHLEELVRIRTRELEAKIIEHKKAEERIEASLKEKELLLKEIHHRVKNNLQIISSIFNLQSGYIRNKKTLEVFNECQNRVKSMSLIHEKLYRSENWSQINMREYVEDLSSKVFSSYNNVSQHIKLVLNIENVHVEVDKCMAIGLILSELISNSIKHAFTGRADGELNICSYRGDKNQLILIVADNGNGLPEDVDFRNSKTLGLQLISLLIEQHNGKLEIDNHNGTKFTISF